MSLPHSRLQSRASAAELSVRLQPIQTWQRLNTSPYTVAIIVDPAFGEQLQGVVARMPAWIADTDGNRPAVERARAASPGADYTRPGGLTTFRVEPDATPEDWFADVLDTVAGHHDRYSHAPGYSAVEVFGVAPTPRLRNILASHRLTDVSERANSFLVSTEDGSPAASPNDAE